MSKNRRESAVVHSTKSFTYRVQLEQVMTFTDDQQVEVEGEAPTRHRCLPAFFDGISLVVEAPALL